MVQKNNKPDFDKPVADLFFVPGKDDGLTLIRPITEMFSEGPRARIFGCAASTNKAVQAKQKELIDESRESHRFRRPIQFTTVPVLVNNLSILHSYRYVGEKFLFNGASSVRFFNRCMWHRRNKYGWKGHRKFESSLVKELERQSDWADEFLKAPQKEAQYKDLDYVIECKNFKNFYHFLTESFCHLSLVDRWGLTGRIFFVGPTDPGERPGFFDRMIQDFYPHLESRIEFCKSPMFFSKALTCFSFREGIIASPQKESLYDLFPTEVAKKEGISSRPAGGVLRQNAFDASQKTLRNIAIHRVIERYGDRAETPKRIWVSRRARPDVRDRSMKGEDYLFGRLAELGFEKVYFEDIRPIDQAHLMQNADVVASYHGAGMANMIYAGTQTTVIEFGNLHTLTYRWEEFMQHASLAGCRYVSFFADMREIEPGSDPINFVRSFKSMGNVPVKLERGPADNAIEYIKFLCHIAGDRSVSFDVPKVAEIVLEMQDWDHFDVLMQSEAAQDVEHWLRLSWQAVRARVQGRLAEAVMYLESAHEENPGRPMLLNRAINLSRKAGLKKKHEHLLKRRELGVIERNDPYG